MAFILNDRVKETTTTTGTSTLDLAGAETGFESFVAGIGNSNTCYYAIVHQTADEFEVGLGTVTDASPDTLSRTTIISSSNSDSAVNFSAGTKDVFCTLPASKAVVEDGSDNIALGAAPTVSNASGDLNLDVVGDIILDAGGEHIRFKDDGTEWGNIESGSSNFNLTASIQDKDFVFLGNDGGSGIVAARIDMSDAGRILAYGGMNVEANTDITFTTGNWTGEKAHKIQAHGNHNYYQTTNSHYFRTYNSGSGDDKAVIDSSGNFTTEGNVTAYGSVSDIRLKENIEVIKNPIEKIKDLKGVTFTYKKDGEKSTGLIAQDLEKVLPEAVYTAETIVDETKGEKPEEHLAIRYGNTVGLLVEAIKEQQEQIETLTAKVKELEVKG
jgi:hypothetical protein